MTAHEPRRVVGGRHRPDGRGHGGARGGRGPRAHRLQPHPLHRRGGRAECGGASPWPHRPRRRRGADVVLVSLADDAAVRATYGGADGLVAGLRTGHGRGRHQHRGAQRRSARSGRGPCDRRGARGHPGLGQRVERRERDDPGHGRRRADDVERARPALESFAQRVILLGPLGAGATMKLAVNAMVFGLNQTLAEALVLAEKAGVAARAGLRGVREQRGRRPVRAYKRAALRAPRVRPGRVRARPGGQGPRPGCGARRTRRGPGPPARTNRRVVGEAIDAGLGAADLSAIARHLRGEAGPQS